MGSGNFVFFTALLVLFVLQTSRGRPLKYPVHTKRYDTTQTHQETNHHKVALDTKHDENYTSFVKRRTLLKSETLSLNDKFSLLRASVLHGVHSMKQHKQDVAYQRAESAHTIQRTKRAELEYNMSHPSQMKTHPEPRPEWKAAIHVWKWAWYLHIHLFAVLYWLVALVSLAFIVCDTRPSAGARKANAALKLSLHLSLLLFSVSRALALSIDPYESRGILGSIASYLLWSAGFPIIITSFGLLLLVLFDTTKLSLAPPRFQNFSLAIGIMGINFVVVMVTDVTVLMSAGARAMMIICHVYLMIAGLTYTAGFMWVGHKISSTVAIIATDNKMRRLCGLINVSAVISLSLFAVQIYAAVAVFGIYSEAPSMLDPWPWYAVQTCLRSLEIGMCIVISTLFYSSAKHHHDFPRRSLRISHTQVSPTLNEITVKQTEAMETKF